MLNKLVSVCGLICCMFCTQVLAQDARKASKPGEQAPPIDLQATLNAPAADELQLGKLKGKVVVLEFWATWCAPCLAAFPHINELAAKYKGKSVVFLSISIDKGTEPVEKIKQLLKGRPLQTYIGLDVESKTTQTNYAVNTIPRTFLIDKNGMLDAITGPGALTAQALDNLLAGKPSGIVSLKEEDNTVPAADPAAADFSLSVTECKNGQYSGSNSSATEMNLTYQPTVDVLAWLYEVNTNTIIIDSQATQKRWNIHSHFPIALGDSMPGILQTTVPAILGYTVSKEKRMMPVYIATCPKGPKTGEKGMLKQVENVSTSHMSLAKGLIAGTRITAGQVISAIENHLDVIVIDSTHLAGRYDVNLSFEQNSTASFIAALNSSGITVKRGEQMVDVLVARAIKKKE